MATSPDLTPFVDLTVADLDPGDLLDLAIAAATTVMPGLVLREGMTESAILEAQAAMDAQLVYAINRLVPALMEGVMNLFGIVRDPGGPATTNITFTVSDSLGNHTIPQGTRVALHVGDDDADAVIFATDFPLPVNVGATTGTVSATATTNGTAANGWVSGTVLDVIDAVSFVNTAVLAATVTGGRDPETDLVFYTRGSQRLARLSSALVTPAQFTAAALEQPYVYRCLAVDNWNGNQLVAPGGNAGELTLAVLGPDGAFLSSANKAALLALLTPLTASFLRLHIIDPAINSQDVYGSVSLLPGYTSATVLPACAAAVRAYLSPLTWAWSGTIRRNELIAVVSNVPGVDYVSALTTPGGDITMVGSAPLASAGAVTFTVAA